VCLTSVTTLSAQCNTNLVFTHNGACVGHETLQIHGADSAAQITWYLDTTIVRSGTDSTYTPLSGGTYHAIVAGNICIDTTTTIAVSPVVVPAVTITATPGDTICLNTSVTFYASSVNGGSNPQYQWKKNNVNVANTATYIGAPILDGVRSYCVLTSNAVCAASQKDTSNLIIMKVHSIPSVSVNGAHKVCAGDSITLTASSANALSYLWNSGSITTTISISTTGSYNVTVTDANGCTAASRPYQVLQTTIPQATITLVGNSLVTGPSQVLSVVFRWQCHRQCHFIYCGLR
jgi:hypothetical protein